MKNILIPTDFSENSWNAIEYALNFFEQHSCNFYLLHVNTISSLITNDVGYAPTQDIIEETLVKPSKVQLKKVLKRISTLPLKANHRFFTLTDYNFFIESIRKHVGEKNIDLIVIGTKGATGLKKLIIGSNAASVITRVQCTTLVVPENATFVKPKEIAFPTDFSTFYSSGLLNPVLRILDLIKASIRVLHINKRDYKLNDDQQRNKAYLEDFFSHHNHSFHFLTNKDIEAAIQCFVESRDIDLIVMVAKNLNYFQRILFHPLVEEITYHTDIPFLVLHE
ncbi:nucleotide-binding universal stress UspA family protein [Jejuia pallidilutea]|jgi:nucleotide-binding universal stress UspA family protein|uniref:Nucleotide-binding universal stress UspA family protein n=1 Tax=Jejuia pallidilutea TaxID=504487 RepID=A0A362XF18_9FLAO|nr:universal stress protein [Jejuia pallidilutea]PQV50450.1 nucleotide-binding universal stress UspA family protein [Jejuia pallidilutea]